MNIVFIVLCVIDTAKKFFPFQNYSIELVKWKYEQNPVLYEAQLKGPDAQRAIKEIEKCVARAEQRKRFG